MPEIKLKNGLPITVQRIYKKGRNKIQFLEVLVLTTPPPLRIPCSKKKKKNKIHVFIFFFKINSNIGANTAEF